MKDDTGLTRAAFAEVLARQGLHVPEERFETVFTAACGIERAVTPLRRRARTLPTMPAGMLRFEDGA